MATFLPGITDFVPDIQPFQPDWATVDKTMRLKQGTYDQNYASLQGTYSGLLNMPQLKQDQIDKRDNFLKQAFKNLGDLSSVDLSLPENVSTANNVFAPLYNDTSFLGNSAISKHYEKQEQYADGLRQTDGGKEFSMDNLNYVRQQKAAYIDDQDPNAWQKYYSNKRYYEPYYDTHKEIRDAMEKFKPSSSSVVRLNGFYKQTTDDASWRQEEIKDYLNGVLSDKAKRQLQIEGTVRLGDPATIAGMYRDTANKNIAQFTSKIGDLDKQITVTKDPAQKSKLIDMKNQYQSAINDTQKDADQVTGGNLDFIKNNQERLATSMYYNAVIDNASKAFAHTDVKQDITENNVAFGMWKDAQETKRFMVNQAGENSRFYAGQAGDDRRLAMRLAAEDAREGRKAAAKGGKDNTPLVVDVPAGPSDVIQPKTLGDLDNTVVQAQKDGFTDSQNLKEHIAEATGTSVSQLTAKDVKMYMSSPKGQVDNEVQGFTDRSNMRHLTIDDANHTKDQAEQYALSKMSPAYATKQARLNVVMNNLAQTDTYNLVDPQGNKITVAPKDLMKMVASKEFSIAPQRGDNYNVTIGGKQYKQADDNKGTLGGIGGAASQVERFLKNDSEVNDYNKHVSEYFGNQKTDLRKAFTFADNNDYIKSTKNKITSLTGIEPSKLSQVAYGPGADKNKIYFSAKGTKAEPVDPQAVVSKLISKGFPTVYNKQTDQYEVSNGSLDTQLDPFARLPGYQRQLISTLETRTGLPGTKYQSTFYALDNKGNKTSYRIDKKFGTDGSNSFYLYPSGSNTPIPQKFNSAFDAYNFSQQMAQNPDAAAAILNQ